MTAENIAIGNIKHSMSECITMEKMKNTTLTDTS
jgi:hypothetical protein